MGSKILPEMAYEGYAVLVAHLDGEPYFRRYVRDRGNHIFTKSGDLLAEKCRSYRRGMVDCYRAFCGTGKDNDPYDSYLYNPVSFVTFGETDCISITAIDDFDPAAWLTTQSTISFRQTCLSFCPTLDFLGLESDEKKVFLTVKDLCTPPGDTQQKQSDEPRPALWLKESPLMAVNYYKMNGMAILGPGLLFQQAVYRAMAATVMTTLTRLRGIAEKAEKNNQQHIISVSDVDSFRCIFLDPQGWSDIASLMFSSNYSVTMSVLVSLRQLRFDDLYNTIGGEDLIDAVNSFEIHEKVSTLSGQIGGDNGSSQSDNGNILGKNHVFCSTYTTLGISEKEFQNGELRCNGVVIAETSLEIDAGHCQDVRRAIEKKDELFKPCEISVPEMGFTWCILGRGDQSVQDLVVEINAERTKTPIPPGIRRPITVTDLVRHLKSIRDCDLISRTRQDARLAQEILKICTTLKTPVWYPSVDLRQHTDMRSVLVRVQNGMFEDDKGNLSIAELHCGLRKIRVAAPVSHSLLNLYTEFASCIGDPFLFERVMDLYDLFLASYELLAKELPKRLDKELKNFQGDTFDRDHLCRAFLSNDDIQDLVELSELMRSALGQRVRLAFREAKRWSTSLDVKGGSLDQLLSAADVPLKCGLGVLRRIMNGTSTVYPRTRNSEDNRRRVGGASAIGCNLRSLSHQLRIGPVEDFFLASVDLNITHLTRPGAFCIHLHEMAHLICDLLGSTDCTCDTKPGGRLHSICYRNRGQIIKDSIEESILERHQDIFSEIVIHSFVFDEDYTTYFRSYMANYSLDSIAHCANDQDTFLRMFEVLIRGFLVTDPFRVKNGEGQDQDPDLYSSDGNRELNTEIIERAYRRFTFAVRDAGPFFFDFRRLWQEDNPVLMGKIRLQFEKVYRETYAPLCCMWKDAERIFDGVTLNPAPGADIFPKLGTDPSPEEAEYVKGKVDEALQAGVPLVRVLFKVDKRNYRNEEYDRLDPFFLIRLVLKGYLKDRFGSIDMQNKRVCIVRNSIGKPCPEEIEKGMEWHTQLIDRNCNGLFAVDPKTRRDYMRARITVIKTFWDVSANLRARRFRDMLSRAENPGGNGD